MSNGLSTVGYELTNFFFLHEGEKKNWEIGGNCFFVCHKKVFDCIIKALRKEIFGGLKMILYTLSLEIHDKLTKR